MKRISPSKEQTEYLKSIGAFETIPSAESPGGSPKTACREPAHSSPALSLPSGLIVFIMVLILLLAALSSRGQSLPDEPPVILEDAGRHWSDLVTATPAAENPVTAPQVTATPSVGGEKKFVKGAGNGADIAAVSRGLSKITLRLDGLSEQVNGLKESVAYGVQVNNAKFQHLRNETAQARISDLNMTQGEMDKLNEFILFQCFGLVTAVVLLVALVYTGRRKVMAIENAVVHTSATKETLFNRARSKISSACAVQLQTAEEMRKEPTAINVAAARAPRLVPMDSPELQNQLVATTIASLKSLKVPPTPPTMPWQLGVISLKGNVRPQNQDVGIAMAIGDCDMLIVADGCGGIPLGREAAYLGVASAGVRLIQLLGSRPYWLPADVEEAIRSAIWAAHHQLALQADDLNIACGDINGGLRSTLIIAVGQKNKLHYGYVGDGGGWIVRTNGKVEQFLVPQKTNILNILDASLGPMMAGNPVLGTIGREPGDLAMIGTDGVFDRIPRNEIEVFGKDILRACIQCAGNLQQVVAQVCDEYAQLKDAAGFICDDNLTLGLMGTRTKPVLGAGFWSSSTILEKAS
ncbi:MAG: protein phosphatase 2C domain-containing protein [Kiritimatiellia bacterium]